MGIETTSLLFAVLNTTWVTATFLGIAWMAISGAHPKRSRRLVLVSSTSQRAMNSCFPGESYIYPSF